MAWITPKTNWVATDYINVADYNRWINNLNELQTLCKKMYALTETNLGSSQSTSDIVYADMLNNIEDALDNLNIASYNFDFGSKTVYSANSSYIEYNEINRIESAMLELYTWLLAQYDAIPILAFTLGNYRGLKL